MDPNETSINFPLPNFITNDESHETSYVEEPTLRATTNYHTKVSQVMSSDLRNFVKSKEDLYVILSIEGQLHLPPFDECTMEFLRDALSGRKKLITNRDLAPVNVPRYKEFNAAKLYKAAMADGELRIYLPDAAESSTKVLNRKFLFNVSLCFSTNYA